MAFCFYKIDLDGLFSWLIMTLSSVLSYLTNQSHLLEFISPFKPSILILCSQLYNRTSYHLACSIIK